MIFCVKRLRDFCVKRFLVQKKFPGENSFFGHYCHNCHYCFVERLHDYFL